jgi:eukaryotic-like serine/threonine-protein kinase
MDDPVGAPIGPSVGTPIGRHAPVAGWSLIRRLGEGAQSQVWLARRGEQVAALKLQPLPAGSAQADAAEAFLAVARVAQGLRHPAIVAVWDAGIEAGVGWLAMEPVPGGDLQRYTREPRLLPEPVVMQVLQQVAEGLAHAHGRGVVHRDLKPANVLVNWADQAVRIADFGLARAAGASRTGTGVVPGTPAYSAPEQLAGAEPDALCDLYALGAMAFELIAGRLPHEASSMGELLRRVAREPVPDLRQLRPATRPALAELVARLLARQRSARPESAANVAALLAGWHGGGRPSR